MQLQALVGGETPLVGPETTVGAVARTMTDDGIDCIIVVNDRRVIGIATERDVVRAAAAGVDLDEAVITDWMSAAPDTFAPETDTEEAAKWLLETGYRHLPVVGEEGIVGVVGIRDLLFALAQ